MKKIIALVVLVLAVAGGVFFFLNQNSGPEKQIIGTWYDSKHDSTIVFNSDKTLEVTNNKDKMYALYAYGLTKDNYTVTISYDTNSNIGRNNLDNDIGNVIVSRI